MLLSPLHSDAQSPPRLEYYKSGSDKLHRVTIERCPFKIGRCETCDLQIDSAEVSREHAQILRRGNIWMIRDLGSTNGTQVNGKPVRECFLADGDILAIAETEVTFVASSVTPFQRMATQRIQPKPAARKTATLPAEIMQLRALTEATLRQVIPVRLQKVVSLIGGETETYLAAEIERLSHFEADLHTLHSMSRRYRELLRRSAIETVAGLLPTARVFLAVDSAEIESLRELLIELEQRRGETGAEIRLGVAISLKNIDSRVLESICHEIRGAELSLGFVDFQGGSGQIVQLASYQPKCLVLCDSMLRGVAPSSQPLHRLESVLSACQQHGINPVIPNCTSQTTIVMCQQIGYELALQDAEANQPSLNKDFAAATA